MFALASPQDVPDSKVGPNTFVEKISLRTHMATLRRNLVDDQAIGKTTVALASAEALRASGWRRCEESRRC
jgi:hypothetical protein